MAPAHGAVLTLESSFLGFFVSGTPYSVLTGSWSATVDTALIDAAVSQGRDSVKVRPDTIVFSEAQTFQPNPSNPAADTTWSTANTYVQVYFNTQGLVTGTVQVHGDVPETFSNGMSSNGTGFNDFVMYYSDGFTNLAAREPLDYFAYNLQGVGSYAATRQGDRVNPIPNTLTNGFLTIQERQSVSDGSGPVDFFGGAAGGSSGGLSIDFAADGDLQVAVNPAATLAEADLFVFNTFSTRLQAWDIDVSGNLVGTSSIYIPYAVGVNPLALKVFHFDEDLGLWELLATRVEGGLLVAETDGFSPLVLSEMNDDEALLALQALNAQQVPVVGTLWLTALGLALLGVRSRRHGAPTGRHLSNA
ncbi:hypothetical protein [Rubrivivax albus]|nr:hypothetical protein [Rubrivivax albus]